MATALAARVDVGPGDLAVIEAIDDDGLPVNLDVDDLDVTVDLDGVETPYRLADDDLSFAVPRPAGITAGRHRVDVHVASDDLGIDLDLTLTATVALAAYGATVAGVEALLTGVTVTYASNPSVADVLGWLDDIGARVMVRIGDLTGLTSAAAFTARARGLVHLGAGAYASDAAHPERAGSQRDERYGAVLWARFEDGLAELEAAVDEARKSDGLPGADGTTVLHPAASFPAPAWRTSTGL